MRFRKYMGAVLLAVGLLAVLSGCVFDSGEHTHTFSKWAVTKAPTCVDTGVQSRECEECGYVESEKIDPLGHTTSKVAAVKATCTTDGLTEGSQCSVCGEILQAQETISAFGHAALKDYAVEPTCTTEGLTEGSHCYICGAVIVEQTVVPASGHKYDKVTIVSPADCMHAGVKQFACLWCDASYNEIYHTTEHTIVTDDAVAPTCTEDGLSQGSHCSVCSLVFAQQSIIPATGHKETADEAREPTCTEVGLTAGSHCSVCNLPLVPQEEVPALGHQNQEEILQEATCQTLGVKQLTCTVCGTVSQEDYEMAHFADKDLYSAAVQFVGEIVAYDRSGSVFGGGIGFVLTSDGKVVTNYHVIAGAYSAKITIHNVTYPITAVLAYSEAMDLAILQVEATDLEAPKICTQPLADGDVVYVLGAARNLTDTYAQGTILAAVKELDGVVYVQHDAVITVANSGGPLVNEYGEIVGINTLATSQAQGMQLSVFASELDKLVYGEPLSMEAFYAQTTSSYQKLVDAILANGMKDGLGNVTIYDHSFDGEGITIYGLGYEPSTQRAYVEMSVSSGGNKILVKLYLTGDPAALAYKCEFSIKDETTGKDTVYNTVTGYLDAARYTSASELTCTTYAGMEGNETFVMNSMYRPKMYQAVSWLATYVQKYIGISIADLGFASFEN